MDLSFIRNRRVSAQEPEQLTDERLVQAWLVSNRWDHTNGQYIGQCEGAPMAYACAASTLELSSVEGGCWVVAYRGNYLRTTGAFSGDRRRVRRFKTATAAAMFAETLIGDFPRPTAKA